MKIESTTDMKKKIAVISSSVRDGRLSHRAALFLQKYINNKGAEVDLIDLLAYDFPIFHERLYKMTSPPADLLDYARRITEADGVVVVSPVYNASFPAALKNAIDVLVHEWKSKPVLIVSVTFGSTAGISTVQQLQALMLKMDARVAPPLYTVLNAGTDFSPEGDPVDAEKAEKYAQAPVAEFMWLVDASGHTENSPFL